MVVLGGLPLSGSPTVAARANVTSRNGMENLPPPLVSTEQQWAVIYPARIVLHRLAFQLPSCLSLSLSWWHPSKKRIALFNSPQLPRSGKLSPMTNDVTSGRQRHYRPMMMLGEIGMQKRPKKNNKETQRQH